MFMTQLGGGFTCSKSFPLYLEGNAAFSRYDPVFIASNGTTQRRVPVAMGQLGGFGRHRLGFPDRAGTRPAADRQLHARVRDERSCRRKSARRGETGRDIAFLDNGYLNAVGYGGSLMLDYEHYRETHEIDVEVRLTDIHLQNFGNTSEAVQGSAMAQSVSLWTRFRAPTGLRSLDRPVRYVLEYAFTHYSGRTGICWASTTSTPSALVSNSTPARLTGGPRGGA